MTVDDFIKDMETCYGPCGKLCLSCPEAHYLKEIKELVEGLALELESYKDFVDVITHDPNILVTILAKIAKK